MDSQILVWRGEPECAVDVEEDTQSHDAEVGPVSAGLDKGVIEDRQVVEPRLGFDGLERLDFLRASRLVFIGGVGSEYSDHAVLGYGWFAILEVWGWSGVLLDGREEATYLGSR